MINSRSDYKIKLQTNTRDKCIILMGRKHDTSRINEQEKEKDPTERCTMERTGHSERDTVNNGTREGKKLKVSQDEQDTFCPDWEDFLILILSSTAKGMGS